MILFDVCAYTLPRERCKRASMFAPRKSTRGAVKSLVFSDSHMFLLRT